MTFFGGIIPTADELNELVLQTGTYTPAFTATGTDPVLGATGFITGKWWRRGQEVTVIVDINVEGAGLDLTGTSWRVGLPYAADTTFHTVALLDAASDIIGHFQSRSDTASQSKAGSVLLATTSEIPDQSMVFYYTGSNSSLGGPDFTTDARLKAIVRYLADPADL